MPPTTSQDPWPLPELQRARRAIVVVDVVESVRLMQEDESGFIDRWRRFVNEVRTEVLPAHGGRMVKSLGDGMLLEFAAASDAVQAALDLQSRIAANHSGRGENSKVHLRVGAHVADVMVDDMDIFGAGVNLAARLASLAGPGEIVISAECRDLLTPGLDADVEDLGERYVKHFDRPLRAFRAGPAVSPISLFNAAHRNPHARLKPALAVIPLASLGADLAEGTLGQAIADELTLAFGARADLIVVSRLSSAAFARRRAGVGEIGSRLGVDYVLSGTLRRDAGKLQLGFELAAVRDETVVWSDRMSCATDSVFSTSGEVLAQVASAVSQAITQREFSRAMRLAAPSLESYTLLIGAISLMHRQAPRDFELARTLLEQLIERHPRLAAPYAWLGKWHVLRVAQGWTHDPVAEGRSARATVARALDQEPDNALSLAIDGLVCAYVQRDLGRARERYDQALAVNPNESLAWLFNSALLAYEQKGAEAADCADHALRLSPLDPLAYYYLTFAATANLAAARYPRTIELAKGSIRANRSHSPAHRNLVIAQALDGQVDAARDSLRTLLDLEPHLTVAGFLSRYPGSGSAQATTYANALREAGLPA